MSIRTSTTRSPTSSAFSTVWTRSRHGRWGEAITSSERGGDLLLGFDVGTSALKAALFDVEGSAVAVATRPIALDSPEEGICEVDPRKYFEALAACCGDLLSGGVEASRIRALAIAAHAETLIPVDERLEPVRPAIVWLDTRSTAESVALAERFGEAELARLSGQPRVIPMWPATKILWLRRHEPETVRATRWWLQPLDYLCARLTGRIVSDLSEQSSSLLVDIRARDWWLPMLDELGVSERSLPELLPAATPLGRIAPAAAAETGLSAETAVVLGGFDQACAALGAGNVREGIASESTGTSLAVTCTIAEPPEVAGSVPCHIHVVPGSYFLCAHNPSGGSVLQWLRATVAPDLSFGELDRLAATIRAGCDGLVLLPYLSGTVTPAFDPAARGVIFGLTLRHGRAHLARAALEGVAFACADLLDEARDLGVSVSELRSVGGGARSDLWSQIKADVTGVPVRRIVAAEHAGALGAAILAGVGHGLLDSIERGADALVRRGATFDPDPRTATAYAEARQTYHELYPRLRDLF